VTPPPKPAGVAKLVVTKRADRRTVLPDGVVRYTIVVANRGNAVAKRVVVCDLVPRRVLYVRRTGAPRAVDGRVCWSLTALSAGQSRSFHLALRVGDNARLGMMVNRAIAQVRGQRIVRALAAVRVRPKPLPVKQPNFTGKYTE
jgi:uncharacterized repeat protein (TIGR01451 family)